MAHKNEKRSAETQEKLISAGRELFVKKGFSETGTPEIVKHAEVTRGALYHHFADKTDLFRAVIVNEAQSVERYITAAAITEETPIDGLLKGASAYFDAMREPGRAQLLLIDGPAVLGVDRMAEIDRQIGADGLLVGLEAAASDAEHTDLPLRELAVLLSSGFDRAALEISRGADPEPYKLAFQVLLSGLFAGPDVGGV